MERKRRNCGNCKHIELPSGSEPCCNCVAESEWEAAPAAGMVWPPVAGFDPGAPEGDMTNVRLDWGESGPEMIGTEDITSESQIEDGHMVEIARDMVKQITRLAYAIEGVRSKIGSIGIRLTDKDMSRDEIAFLVGQLNAMQCDLFELEEERERKLRGAADVTFKDRDA